MLQRGNTLPNMFSARFETAADAIISGHYTYGADFPKTRLTSGHIDDSERGAMWMYNVRALPLAGEILDLQPGMNGYHEKPSARFVHWWHAMDAGFCIRSNTWREALRASA